MFSNQPTAPTHTSNQIFNTPGNDMVSAGLVPVQTVEESESSKASPTIQIQSEDDWRRLRRAIITRRR